MTSGTRTARPLDELLDEAAEFVPDAPDAVQELADHVITRTGRLLNYENCYGEGIAEALEKAQDVHLAACEAGSPDPDALAERLATGRWKAGGSVPRRPLQVRPHARCGRARPVP